MELKIYKNKEHMPNNIRLVVINNAEFGELFCITINDHLNLMVVEILWKVLCWTMQRYYIVLT